MVVCATQKTMRNLHLEREEISAPPSADTQHWYANLLRILRVKYYLLTESASLVTVLFPAKGLTSVPRFAAAASDVIHNYFARRAWERLITTQFDLDPTGILVCRTQDKRVLGSMNDFAWQAEVLMAERHLRLEEVIDLLNECPMSYLGMESPELVVERLLGRFQ
jgi:hypothetical protein